MIQQFVLLTSLLGRIVSADSSNTLHYPYPSPNPAPRPASKVLYQFPTTSWIENIAVRRNGNLLVTQNAPEAALFTLQRPWSQTPSVKILQKFPSVTGLLGIAEPSPDLFVVVGCNSTMPGQPVNGTAETWLVDFRGSGGGYGGYGGSGGPSVKQIARHPNMAFPNGMAALPGVNDIVLISDSALGLIWRLEIKSGKTKVAVRLSEMAPYPDSPLQIGVNGIKVVDGYLYFSHTFAGTLYRVPIDPQGYPQPHSQAEKVARAPGKTALMDDFTHDERGFWGTTNAIATVFFAPFGGQPVTVAGGDGDDIVAKDTACAFGRTQQDQKTLYVTTADVPADKGKSAIGGKVVAVDTSSIGSPSYAGGQQGSKY
ncbi:hypothetical protein HIM_02561 [Hirsutella minnesotensis 3608]|nr:hypothetical protein HIM_02561 [Hirsutella minnesotensis 3608]